MMRAKLLALLFIGFLLLAFCGCGKSPQSRIKQDGQGQGQEQNKVKVAVSLPNLTSDDRKIFQYQMGEGAKKENLEISWLNGEKDVMKQNSDVAQAALGKAKVVVIDPLDPVMLKKAIAEAQKNGAKILCIHALPPDISVDGYISPDYARAGEMQAQQLLQLLKGGNPIDVLILREPGTSQPGEQILQGNQQILKDNKNIGKLIVEEIPAADTSKAFAVTSAYLKSASPPGAILAHSPETTAGVLQAVRENQALGKVVTVGIGAGQSAVEALKKGEHQAEIDLMPEMHAQIVLQAVVRLSRSEPWEYDRQLQNGAHSVPARYTPIRTITAENVSLLDERSTLLQKAQQQQQQQGQGKTQGQQGQSGQQSQQSQNQGQNQQSGQQSQQQGQSQQAQQGQGGKVKTLVKIKTKDGQILEVNINGQVQSIELQDQTSAAGGQEAGKSSQ